MGKETRYEEVKALLPALGQPAAETLRIQTMGEPTIDLTGYEQQQHSWLM